MTEPSPLPVPDAAVLASLRGRHLLRELDFTPEQWMALVQLAAQLKADKKAGREVQHLRGRNIALIFEKTSTRTRCSFEVGAADQGAHTTYLDPSGSQMGHKESVADTARVLGRMFVPRRLPGQGHHPRRAVRRTGVERPDRRLAPHPDALRPPDHAGARGQAGQ